MDHGSQEDPLPTSLSHFGAKFIMKFEPVASPGRIVPMEGMRGLAALLVFFVHFRALFGHYAAGTLLDKPIDILGTLGHTGVDLFFILSGYLIYGIVMDHRFNFGRFLGRRIRRLYPTFLAVFAVCLVASYMFPTRSKLPQSPSAAVPFIVANLLMLPGMLPVRAIITVAWSLSYEWFFYLSLPIVVAGLRVRRWPWRLRAVAVLLLSAGYVVASQLHLAQKPRLAMFGAGVLLWELLRNTNIIAALPRKGEIVAAVLFVLNLLAIGTTHKIHGGSTAIAVQDVPVIYVFSLFVSGFLLALYALAYHGFLSRFFSLAALRWVGNMSYSYYLIHGLTIVAIAALVQRLSSSSTLGPAVLLLLLGSCLVASLVVSSLLYLYIERPLSLVPSYRRELAKQTRNLEHLSTASGKTPQPLTSATANKPEFSFRRRAS